MSMALPLPHQGSCPGVSGESRAVQGPAAGQAVLASRSWEGDAVMFPALVSAPSGPSMGSLTRACSRQQEGASFPGLWLRDTVPLVTVPAEPGAEGAEAAALSALLEGAEILRDCRQMGLLHDEPCNPSFPNAEQGALLCLEFLCVI